jgi:Family of unknown function (DUF5519)
MKKKSRWANRIAYLVQGREVAHFHSDRELDIRLTRTGQRELMGELKADRRVKFRRHPSEWITVTGSTLQDADFAVRLVDFALKANSAC